MSVTLLSDVSKIAEAIAASENEDLKTLARDALATMFEEFERLRGSLVEIAQAEDGCSGAELRSRARAALAGGTLRA